ncbi:MAG: UDP-N-acetylglucosamine 2-epimerase (non-hydrolyzing) [Syntrophomonas sp.]
MKIMTILGTRPEIIRLSRIILALDGVCEHVLVHTGQNFDRNLNEIFFQELELRLPDYVLNCRGTTVMEQIACILRRSEKVLKAEHPDRILILGDTNSALSALTAKRMGIPVFHMEAGNRCYDDRVPEEVNRRVIDHCSDILLPYTERSRANLLREGIASQKIMVTGNPIREVLNYYAGKIEASNALSKYQLEAHKFFLVTLHRAENVDVPQRLNSFVAALEQLHQEYQFPVICSVHPHTRAQLQKNNLFLEAKGLQAYEPLGLIDFLKLEKNAFCVLSDSGTVQEECCLLGIPNVILRDVSERPETMEAGSSLIAGHQPDSILNAVKAVRNLDLPWLPPDEYLRENVSETVSRILLSVIPRI